MTTRRSFFAALLASLAVALPIAADARGGRRGCGSRGGAGYRKANGKCAGRNE